MQWGKWQRKSGNMEAENSIHLFIHSFVCSYIYLLTCNNSYSLVMCHVEGTYQKYLGCDASIWDVAMDETDHPCPLESLVLLLPVVVIEKR